MVPGTGGHVVRQIEGHEPGVVRIGRDPRAIDLLVEDSLGVVEAHHRSGHRIDRLDVEGRLEPELVLGSHGHATHPRIEAGEVGHDREEVRVLRRRGLVAIVINRVRVEGNHQIAVVRANRAEIDVEVVGINIVDRRVAVIRHALPGVLPRLELRIAALAELPHQVDVVDGRGVLGRNVDRNRPAR